MKGLVQGVGFRYFTQKKALEFGLVGTVQNLENGDVLIEVTGQTAQINQFISWCHLGPKSSKVVEIKIDPLQEPSTEDYFEIIR